jgi:Tol biopolymer transport system component
LDIGGEVPHLGFESTLIALSPDGRNLVYVGRSELGKQLYLRSMDSLQVTPIPGTGDALHPFFSPDGLWLGFLTTDKVKKVSLQGGAPVTLCDFQNPTRASWGLDGSIYVTSIRGSSVARVPPEGGEPSAVMASAPDLRMTWFDQVLPDGKSALITDWSRGGISSDYADILLLSFETLETTLLIEGGYDARYVASGHLLFARSGNLLAVPFDLERLEVLGEPVPVVSNATMDSQFGQAQVAVSDSGSLIYVPGGDLARGKLAWVDRHGETEYLPVPEELYGFLDLAPGGERVAVHVADVRDFIWIYDLGRNEGRRLLAEGQAGWPVWAPDGKRLAYYSWQGNDRSRVLTREFEGGGPATELLTNTLQTYPSSWSPDARAIALTGGEGLQAGLLLVDEPGEPVWFHPDGRSWSASFSPDGRWLAYTWTETGRAEVWARSFPGGEVMRQISVEGGVEPVWCETCGELFYRQGGRWLASRVTLGPELAWEPPRLVFETDFVDTKGHSYDVSPDGQRLLVVKRTRQPAATKLHVIQNWADKIEQPVAGADGR